MENLVVRMKRTDKKVHFEGISGLNPDILIPMDFAPYGDGKGLAGLEALLISFSGCVSTAIVLLLGRLGKHITDYEVTAEGIRNEQPLYLKEILFHVNVKSNDVTEADMQAVLKQAEAISPVWLAIKNNVAVKTTFELA